MLSKVALKFFQFLLCCDLTCHDLPQDASNRTFSVVAVGVSVGTVAPQAFSAGKATLQDSDRWVRQSGSGRSALARQ